MANLPSIVAANLRLLEQAHELIGKIPDAAFSAESAVGKPVGPHFRHVLEHFSCFLAGLPAAGLEPSVQIARIDYDSRAREAAIETEREAARERLRELIGGLMTLEGADLDRAADARLESGLGDEDEQWSRTTLRRELHFLLSHTIHHYALIGLLLAQHGVDPGAEFGVAPSTLKYWRSQTSCAPLPG